MWRDLDPPHRRIIVGAGTIAGVVILALVLLFNRYWFGPKSPPPDYSAYLSVQQTRELLMDDFYSYDDEQQVTSQLVAAGRQWTVERLQVKCAKSCPPYAMVTLKVPAYLHHEIEGKLTLELFNNRLYSAVFTPTEPKAYLKRLNRAGIRLKKQAVSRWEKQVDNLRIASNIIYATSKMGHVLGTQPYVSWEDMRLVEQSQGWYENYGNKTTLTPIKSSGPGTEP